MADQLRRDGQATAAPSESHPSMNQSVDLDAAIARADAARRSTADTESDDLDDDDDDDEELEAEDAGSSSDDNPSDTEPEDDDDEDDEDEEDDDDEGRTPSELDEDDDEDSQDVSEAPSKKKTDRTDDRKAGKGKSKAGRDSERDEGTGLSRKQRGKLIAELRSELESEQRAKAELESKTKQYREEEERLDQEVQRVLGTDEQYNELMEKALAGDEDARSKVRRWRVNREFYKKLTKKAEKDERVNVVSMYWDTARQLPGINPQILREQPLSDVMRHIHQAGAKTVGDAAQERINELEQQVETWKGKYQTLKARAGGKIKRSPVGGGGAPVANKPFSLDSLLDPDTGLPTDAAEALVRKHGVEAVFNRKTKTKSRVR